MRPGGVAVTRHRAKGRPVVHRPQDTSAFEFVTLARLRAAQLVRGCLPLVEGGHKIATTAQIEVATGKIARVANAAAEPVIAE